MIGEKSRATTGEILGSFRNGKINPAWRQHYLRLIDLRDALQTRQNRLAQEARDPLPSFSEHMAEAGSDQYEQDFGLSMLSSDQNALYQIEQALNRIRNGSYGVCELTGEPIEPERLLAIPWTRFSLCAQQTLERQGKGGRIHFAPLGELVHVAANEESEASGNEEEPFLHNNHDRSGGE